MSRYKDNDILRYYISLEGVNYELISYLLINTIENS